MKSYSVVKYVVCNSHKVLRVLNGQISGGKSYKQADKSDMWIILDSGVLDDYIEVLDTGGIIESVTYHTRMIIFPIQDRKIPKNMSTFDTILEEMYEYLKDGKRVHISCIGGHGRTGTVIGCFLGKYCKDITDPVAYIRKEYCKKAVETYEQHCLVNKYAKIAKPDYREYAKPVFSYRDSSRGYGLYEIKEGETYDEFMKRGIREICQKGGETRIGQTEDWYY